MKNQFRNNGAIGALLDEYEKSIIELQDVISSISKEELVIIADKITEDPECKSIQTVLTHVINSGYYYAIVIRNYLGESINNKEEILLNSIEEYSVELQKMFQYNVQLFEDYPNIEIEVHDKNKKILTRWGQRYDVEQLLEHAIVHVLRHRRQVEKFLIKINR